MSVTQRAAPMPVCLAMNASMSGQRLWAAAPAGGMWRTSCSLCSHQHDTHAACLALGCWKMPPPLDASSHIPRSHYMSVCSSSLVQCTSGCLLLWLPRQHRLCGCERLWRMWTCM